MEKKPLYCTLVAIEGPDGVGKTTLMKRLIEKINTETNYEAVGFRDPGGLESSERIRELIFDLPEAERFTQLMMFYAARSELYSKKLLPEMKKGKIVFVDRFILSSMVYQGNLTLNNELYKTLTRNDDIKFVNILLDAPEKLLFRRLDERKEEDKNFFDEKNQVRKHAEQYRKIFHVLKSFPTVCPESMILGKIIVHDDDIEKNTQAILDMLNELGVANEEYDNLIDKLIIDEKERYKAAIKFNHTTIAEEFKRIVRLGEEDENIKPSLIDNIIHMSKQLRIGTLKRNILEEKDIVEIYSYHAFIRSIYDRELLGTPVSKEELENRGSISSITIDEELEEERKNGK